MRLLLGLLLGSGGAGFFTLPVAPLLVLLLFLLPATATTTTPRGAATEAAAAAGENGSREQIKVRLAAPVGHADFVVCGWGKSQSGPLAPWAAEVEAVVSSL